MQKLISRVEDLAGIEMNHTTSLVVIFGIIFDSSCRAYYFALDSTARFRKNVPTPVPACGCKLLPRINYSIVRLLRCKASLSIFGTRSGYKKAVRLRISWTTCAQLWIMTTPCCRYFLLTFIFNLSQKWPAASQLPAKANISGY